MNTTLRYVLFASLTAILGPAPAMANEAVAPVSQPAQQAAQPTDGAAAPSTAGDALSGNGSQPTTAPRKIMIHLEGDPEVELAVYDEKASEWRIVCRAPCDVAVSTEEVYRAQAPEVPPSRSFRLDALRGDRAVLRVDTPSSAGRTIGVVAIVVGATPPTVAAVVAVAGALVLGVVVILACPVVAAFGGEFGECAGAVFGAGAKEYVSFITRPVVLGVLGGSVALGLTGVVLTLGDGSTDVDIEAARATPIAPKWREPFHLPRTASLPIVSGTF